MNYSAVSHPSLPNYLALTSGSTNGITNDCTDCPVSARSLFEQLGVGWRSYLESMPQAGYLGAFSGLYAKKHNPAAYYTRIASQYTRQAVPLGSPDNGTLARDLRQGTLRRFSLIVPNVWNDEHDCPIAIGDHWLRTWIPLILASPVYRSGQTLLVITYDEGTTDDNRVYTVALNPAIDGGRMQGFVAQPERARDACVDRFNPACASVSVRHDVMGFHDGREIPNYWAYASSFVLQDHMFGPAEAWSVPSHFVYGVGLVGGVPERVRSDVVPQRFPHA